MQRLWGDLDKDEFGDVDSALIYDKSLSILTLNDHDNVRFLLSWKL